MRIARVIGKITLNQALPDLVPGSYLLVRPQDRGNLAGATAETAEPLVLYDNMAAREGDMVGLVEGREATAPFYPKKVPFDSYNACILDDIDFDPILEVR